jgi:hypothetical protein
MCIHTIDIPDELEERLLAISEQRMMEPNDILLELIGKYSSFLELFKYKSLSVIESTVGEQPELTYTPDQIINMMPKYNEYIKVESQDGKQFLICSDFSVDTCQPQDSDV